MNSELKSSILEYLCENIGNRHAIDDIQEKYDIGLFDLMEGIGRSREFKMFDSEHPGKQGVSYAEPGERNKSWRNQS